MSQVQWYGAYSALALVSQMAVFLYVESIDGFDLDETSQTNIAKCSGSTPSLKDVENGNILSAGAVLLGFGALIGTIIRFYYLKLGSNSRTLSIAKFVICLLIKVVLLLPGVILAAIVLSQKQKLESLITMLLATAIPSMYLGTILYSGLELWIYAKLSGQTLHDSEYEKSETEGDIESGT